MKTVVMNVTRPISPTESHVEGSTVTIADDLADYYLSTGAARYATLQQTDARLSRVETDGSVNSVVAPGGELAGVNASTDANNNTVLVGADGGLLRGPMTSGVWFTSPSVFRLRLTGTGSVQFDSRDSAGTITAVAAYALSGATDQIEFPYAGDNAVAIRATFNGDITVEVL